MTKVAAVAQVTSLQSDLETLEAFALLAIMSHLLQDGALPPSLR